MTGHQADGLLAAFGAAVALAASVALLTSDRRRRRVGLRLAALTGQRRGPSRRQALRRLRRTRPGTDPGLPLAAGLLAACLAAGAAPGAAAGAVGTALGGPVGDRLRRAGAELRLGGDPAVVWGAFGTFPGAAGLARRLELAETSGAPVAAAVAAEAAESRARRRRAAQGSARRAAVAVTGPLGLCFLPAFLLIGVVPVVIGLTKELL
ncbi:type II secretion system F family protein [Streptomyces avicenniae]|uniref:type II secretion system F family protein n=1 Tax=Streptomyces avicenniae TaxID=500153 RepID=UPI00069B5EC7|nr:type II secretion system F family protein [Streptomyces avicenniae]